MDPIIMKFMGEGRQETKYGPFLIILYENFVEVHNAANGRLRQIISGRDVKCLDKGPTGPGNIKKTLQYPKNERIQLVVELVRNEACSE
jgi:hypothetical protein